MICFLFGHKYCVSDWVGCRSFGFNILICKRCKNKSNSLVE